MKSRSRVRGRAGVVRGVIGTNIVFMVIQAVRIVKKSEESGQPRDPKFSNFLDPLLFILRSGLAHRKLCTTLYALLCSGASRRALFLSREFSPFPPFYLASVSQTNNALARNGCTAQICLARSVERDQSTLF